MHKRAQRFAGAAIGLCAVVACGASALAVPTDGGPNFLGGKAYGLDENYIGPAYVMPDGSVGGAGGTVGMTESITIGGGPGGASGVWLPQPALLPAADARSAVLNPFWVGPGAPAARWGARTGAVLRWDTLDNTTTNFLAPAGSVTGVAYNLNPKFITSLSAPLSLAGGAPGSIALDNAPDFIPFTVDLVTGKRFASFQLSIIGRDDGAAFGGSVPAALMPKVEFWEGGAIGELTNTGGQALVESDFKHDGSAFTGPAADFRDGSLLLIGELFDAFANLTFTETGVGTGLFELDIAFFTDVLYTGGSLVTSGQVALNSTGTASANWENIPFGIGALGGLDFNGLTSFDFRPQGPLPQGSFSADQNFTVIIPEPITAASGLLALAGLGLAALRRRAA